MLYMKLGSGMNVGTLLFQMALHQELWNQNLERIDFKGSPHRETQDIWLRYHDKERAVKGEKGWHDEQYPIWYPGAYALPAVKPMLLNLMASVGGESLHGALIYKIPPGKKIYPHTDPGWHVNYTDKFNIYLQSDPKTVFNYPRHGEQMRTNTGDVYWFRNDVEHEVINEGDSDHIVLTCCIHIDKKG
jgi:hypothetical protein